LILSICRKVAQGATRPSLAPVQRIVTDWRYSIWKK
jgi:hypothetical protein